MGTIRKPVVEGAFYNAGKNALRRQIEECFMHPLGPGVIPEPGRLRGTNALLKAVVCPHAGYMYSGPVAAWSYAEAAKCGILDTVILLGPNHRGAGNPVCTTEAREWQTPLGRLNVDTVIADALCSGGFISRDERAHAYEHSLEVQLPFLQYIFKEAFKIVPVTFLRQNLTTARKTAELLHALSADFSFLVVASSDMTHYEPQSDTERKDKTALQHIMNLDAGGLEKAIIDDNITMCGYCPVMAAMEYAKMSGVKNARLLRYATSGDVSGDKSHVVGYAAVSLSAD